MTSTVGPFANAGAGRILHQHLPRPSMSVAQLSQQHQSRIASFTAPSRFKHNSAPGLTGFSDARTQVVGVGQTLTISTSALIASSLCGAVHGAGVPFSTPAGTGLCYSASANAVQKAAGTPLVGPQLF